jgi:chaperonin cofactor prefoldin
MSEDPTQNLEQRYGTNPTLDTVVQMLGELREHMNTRFDGLESRIDRVESEMLMLRADFRDFRTEVRERLKETA